MNKRYIYNLLVFIGIISYLVSLFSPLLSISEFYIFSDTLSLMSISRTLFSSGEWLLFFAIFIFGFLLPSIKYLLLLLYGMFPNNFAPTDKTLSFLEGISKWAMLDVFIIAILIASIKIKSLTTAHTHYGLYLFAVAVIIAMACSSYYKNVLHNTNENL